MNSIVTMLKTISTSYTKTTLTIKIFQDYCGTDTTTDRIYGLLRVKNIIKFITI